MGGSSSKQQKGSFPRLNAHVDASLCSILHEVWRSSLAKQQNCAVSPISISTAMHMALYGARGECRKEMNAVLGGTSSESKETPFSWFTDFAQAAESTRGSGSAVEFLSYNAVFAQESEDRVTRKYAEECEQVFRASVHMVDFVKKARAAVALINDTVAEHTQDMITELVSEDNVNENTELVLLNVMFFKGKWQHQFDKKRTRDVKFRLLASGGNIQKGGKKKEKSGSEEKDSVSGSCEVPMMYLKNVSLAHCQACSMDGLLPKNRNNKSKCVADIVNIPYEGGFSMWAVRPVDTDPEQMQTLHTALCTNWRKTMQFLKTNTTSQKMDVLGLPRMRLASDMNLVSAYKSLGMELAFGSGADFSGMSASSLRISDIIHSCVLEVDEEGTKAAAATAVVMTRCSISFGPRIVFDSPFLAFVVHDASACLLFAGMVTNPSA